MEMLAVLEKKITTLVGLVKELQAKNELLKKELVNAQEELGFLAAERDQMTVKIQAFEEQEAGQREQTKCMVDSLINDIDVLLSKEHQL
jgi:predicted  nucleic acid-binding Zn-ribbon protein